MGFHYQCRVCGKDHIMGTLLMRDANKPDEDHTIICPAKKLPANYKFDEFYWVEDRELEQYLSMRDEIDAYSKANKFDKVIEVTLNSIPLIINIAKSRIDEYEGKVFLPCPEFENLIAFLPVLHRRDDLQSVKSILQRVPELGGWVRMLDHSLDLEESMHKIEILLKANPGFIQAKIAKELGYDRHDIANMCVIAEKLGIIKRERYLFTYKVYLVK
jgi:hypothetical protein